MGPTRERDLNDEHAIAVTTAGLGDALAACQLTRFADDRALPGGVRIGLDGDQEAAEELADARNYLIWSIQDAETSEDRERRRRALRHVTSAYRELRGTGHA